MPLVGITVLRRLWPPALWTEGARTVRVWETNPDLVVTRGFILLPPSITPNVYVIDVADDELLLATVLIAAGSSIRRWPR
jgi:hypothetical protein